MNHRYLLGPVTPYHVRCWQAHCQQGLCLAFNASGSTDVSISPYGRWEDVYPLTDALRRDKLLQT
jgi:hypothetical protein